MLVRGNASSGSYIVLNVGAVFGVVGVASTSTVFITSATSAQICMRTRCACTYSGPVTSAPVSRRSRSISP